MGTKSSYMANFNSSLYHSCRSSNAAAFISLCIQLLQGLVHHVKDHSIEDRRALRTQLRFHDTFVEWCHRNLWVCDRPKKTLVHTAIEVYYTFVVLSTHAKPAILWLCALSQYLSSACWLRLGPDEKSL